MKICCHCVGLNLYKSKCIVFCKDLERSVLSKYFLSKLRMNRVAMHARVKMNRGQQLLRKLKNSLENHFSVKFTPL